MPNSIWEQIGRILDFIILLFPIFFVLILLSFVGMIVIIIRFHKRHQARLREMEEFSKEHRKYIEEQRKKHQAKLQEREAFSKRNREFIEEQHKKHFPRD